MTPAGFGAAAGFAGGAVPQNMRSLAALSKTQYWLLARALPDDQPDVTRSDWSGL
jgi:hypothetical protein